MTATVLNVGSRGRITLGGLAKSDHYRAEEGEDGTLILTPLRMMSDAEARVLANPKALALLREDPEQQATRSVERPPRRRRKDNAA